MTQALKSGIGYVTARDEAFKPGFTCERDDCAVSDGRSHQVNGLQSVAEGKVGNSGIRNPRLPAHLKRSKFRQVIQRLKRRIRHTPAEFKHLQLWHVRNLPKSFLRHLLRIAKVQSRYMIQPGEPLQNGISHLP